MAEHLPTPAALVSAFALVDPRRPGMSAESHSSSRDSYYAIASPYLGSSIGQLSTISHAAATVTFSQGNQSTEIEADSAPCPLQTLRQVTSAPRRLADFTLCRVLRIPLIRRNILRPRTLRLLDTPPRLHRLSPLPPPGPQLFFTLAPLPWSWHSQPAVLEMVKDPEPHQPWRQHNVDHGVLLAEKEGAASVGLFDECLEVTEELSPCFFNRVRRVRLVLAEAVEGRYDSRTDVVDPDPASGPLVRIIGVEILSIFLRVRVNFVQVLADDGALVERLCLLPIGSFGTAERGHQAAWVELEEGLGFVVGVDLDVLVGDLLFFEHEPGSLDEGAEPAGVELERLLGLVGFDESGGGAGGVWVQVCVYGTHGGS